MTRSVESLAASGRPDRDGRPRHPVVLIGHPAGDARSVPDAGTPTRRTCEKRPHGGRQPAHATFGIASCRAKIRRYGAGFITASIRYPSGSNTNAA